MTSKEIELESQGKIFRVTDLSCSRKYLQEVQWMWQGNLKAFEKYEKQKKLKASKEFPFKLSTGQQTRSTAGNRALALRFQDFPQSFALQAGIAQMRCAGK